MLERGRVRESGRGAAELDRHLRVLLGEAAQVHLVDHAAGPRDLRATRRAGAARARLLVPAQPFGEGRQQHALGHVRRAVGLVARPVAERARLRCVQREGTVEGARVRIDEQLDGIEAVPLVRCPRAVRAQPVTRAGDDAFHEAVEDRAGALGQREAGRLDRARVIEQAEFDRGGVLREDRDVRAPLAQRHPQRCWAPGEDARHDQSASACVSDWRSRSAR
jgi:hypothetical protein